MLIKVDPGQIDDKNVASTSQRMLSFLQSEWSAIPNSLRETREPIAFFLRQLLPYTSFGTRLLYDGLADLLISCLAMPNFTVFPPGYVPAIVSVASFYVAMPFTKIRGYDLGRLSLLFELLPPAFITALLPEEQSVIKRLSSKFRSYRHGVEPYFSDQEIMATYGLSGGPVYKQTYRKHFRMQKQLEAMFKAFVERVHETNGVLPYGEQTGLARVLGASESNIRYWKAKVLRVKTWRPWDNDRGEARRLFTDEVEADVAKYIRETYFEKDLLFCNEDFKQLMFDLWCEDKDNWLEMDRFKCSPTFISDFKKRNHISSRRLHYKRRPKVTEEDKIAWVSYVRGLLREVNHDFIINMDETHWQTFPNGILTWRMTGDDAVQVRIDGNEKQGLTVLASVTASGQKLPLLILAKGKTQRCEQTQLPEDIGAHFKFHSQSGWSTREVMMKYLELLREQFPAAGGGAVPPRLHLILDMYASHRMDDVIAAANDMNIEFHFIPPGLTDEFQPLDRRVFGCLKAAGKTAFRHLYRKNPEQKFNTRCAVECLVKAWNHLSSNVIDEAWGIYTTNE